MSCSTTAVNTTHSPHRRADLLFESNHAAETKNLVVSDPTRTPRPSNDPDGPKKGGVEE